MHVLLVEDDALIASGIVSGLKLHAVTVDHVESARTARLALEASHFDLLILDLGLPDEDGMSFLKRLRATGVSIPILILTARDAIEHRVAGLQAGADDYLLKPFDLGELIARLQALQRRVAGRSTNVIRHGTLCFDPANLQVTLDGTVVDLSRRELSLLQALLQNPNRVLSTEQVKDSLYGLEENVESNAVNVHIHHLRRKLGPKIIETVRGLGYRLGEAGK
ncbi:response regulator transcription factor [Oxalobacteraceae bacterium R-40]|uniref:Response regulator transcription factor n=1 Tax=Keguizhuia sedimenti TaxID=3064264 RepID=A0ABU1BTM5_9BURK|nr:response regulator transcription factor [Oxalobacteraceae bacterium R-40]